MTAVGFALAAGTCLLHAPRPDQQPVPCTCRDLHERPGDYAGRAVRVDLAGAMPADGGAVWYAEVPGGPAVSFSFADPPPPDPLPGFVVGYCRAPVGGGPVRVVGCRHGP